MIRTTVNKAWIKRSFRPLYGWTQMTPKAMLLDPLWDRSVAIFPGMVMMKTQGDKVTLINATGTPYGLSAFYEGGDSVNEISDQGVNACAVWVLGPDAEAEILSPAFDTGAAFVDPGNGTTPLLHAIVDGANRGKLAPAGTVGRGTLSARAVCRLLRVDGPSKIIVGGLTATDA